ncbi:semaphorin-4B-like [Trematomus bernacchii]|uniref:semaphorin-4B-like n=1 Tax=Trematomus bernacchii TaxID=40690 RepID=UPI00146D943C|nr:semaphorin-4B-like [Trematomus bernacchii]
MPPSLLFLLLFLLSSSVSLPPPRNSFLLNSAERPLVFFRPPDLLNSTTLLLSDDGSTLFVGARDAVFSLDVSQSDVISLKRKVEWRPSQSEITECQNKGKDAEVDCPNFVSVLSQVNSSHLYVCGSFAFSPHDAFIDAESFSLVGLVDAKAKLRCPFSPLQRNSALTVDGELFTASTTDFRGKSPQISRHFSRGGQDVSQDTSIALLQEPAFVGSAAVDRKLLFFFTEGGKEFSFVDELRIARVAQVCKDDVGGQRTLQNKWTSFAKAPLLCQVPRQLPFNVLQHVFTLPPPEGDSSSETLFYGVFTSQWSSGAESAVCVFKLQDVQAVFNGSYRTFDTQTHLWNSLLGKHSHLGQCGLDSATDSELSQVKKSFLTSGSVKSDDAPLVSSDQRYSRVAVMRTKALNGKQYTVLFLLTESGFLHKVLLLAGGSRVIEEIQVFTQPQIVKSIVLSSSKGMLYVGTSEGVTGVPVSRCSVHSSCSQCVLARDPQCGWSRTGSVCTAPDANHPHMAQDLEDGNVKVQCQGETKAIRDTEVFAAVNEVVILPCVKPSQPSSLTWTSSCFTNLPQSHFLRSADGALSFIATAHTFGKYRCEAREAGVSEVVASFNVGRVLSPRAFSPVQKNEEDQVTKNEEDQVTKNEEDQVTKNEEDEPLEDIFPEDPFTLNPEEPHTPWKAEHVSDSKDETLEVFFSPALREDLQSRSDDEEAAPRPALLVVSLLLALCVGLMILGGLLLWRRDARIKISRLLSPEEGGASNAAMERVASLGRTGDEPSGGQ